MSENIKTDNALKNLLLQADNPDMETRDQFPSDRPNPHVAPGWNTIMVQDIIAGMFMLEASERKNSPANENHPDFTDTELDQCLPGFTDQVKEAVTGHITSDRLYTVLHNEVRDIARAFVKRMTPQERQTLLDMAAAKLTDSNQATWNAEHPRKLRAIPNAEKGRRRSWEQRRPQTENPEEDPT